jgi:colicin import membrane protein
VTTTRQHIEDLDTNQWARLTRRAAAESVEASTRLGLRPRQETLAVAAMTEDELAEHRQRNGPAKKRPSTVMQLVEADQRSRQAVSRAREAHQGRLDAEAAASIARAEADGAGHATEAARESVRAVEAEAAERDRQRARERAADQQAVHRAGAETERVRIEAAAEIEQVRADAAAEIAAAHERVHAAEARAEQRATERTAERQIGERALQELQAQLDKVRADAGAEVAAAQERARAAEARADDRVAERAAERAAGQEALARLRGESERVRADAVAEIAAIRGQADGVVAAARQAADEEIATVRQAAQTEIDEARRAAEADIASVRAYADDVSRQAQEEVARVKAVAPVSRLLTIPIAPVEVRAQIRRIEDLLDALYQIDFVLEIGMGEAGSQHTPDAEFVGGLRQTVQDRVRDLSDELAHLPARFTDQSDAETATIYANAAGGTYRALLERIEVAVQQLAGRNWTHDHDIIEAVSAMLADPWVQALR